MSPRLDRRFPRLNPPERERLLAEPRGRVRAILDTDAANEIDDQFALTWALLSPSRIGVEAIVAEPYSFAHLPDDVAGTSASRASDLALVGPDEGMERSFQEILRVTSALGISSAISVFPGARTYLGAPDEPVDSPGARKIVATALDGGPEPLYVLAIGCLTNVASALLLEPEIVRRVVVVWTSGYPTAVPRSNRPSLNLVQDPAAVRVVLDSGVPLVYLPGFYIGSELRLSLPDVEAYVRNRGAIGDYLHHLYTHNPIHAMRGIDDLYGRSWVIWDMIDVAWVLNPDWVPTELVAVPDLGDDLGWRRRPGAHRMREAHAVDRDSIFRDFFAKLEAHAASLGGPREEARRVD